MIAVRSGPSSRTMESEAQAHTLRELHPVAIKITTEVNTDCHPDTFTTGKDSSIQEMEDATLDAYTSHKMELGETV